MEQIQYNLLFRWFIGPGVDDPAWVPTVFTKNRDRYYERLLRIENFDAFIAPVPSQPREDRQETSNRKRGSFWEADQVMPLAGRVANFVGVSPSRLVCGRRVL